LGGIGCHIQNVREIDWSPTRVHTLCALLCPKP